MKSLGFTSLMLVLVQVCVAQTNTQPTAIPTQTPTEQTPATTTPPTLTPDQVQTITNVFKVRLQARIKATTQGYDHLTGKPVYLFHNFKYLKLIEEIDTTGSPQDFRLAWLDYVQAWERKLDGKRQLEDVEEVTGGMVEAVASHGLYLEGAARASADVGKRTVESDTVEAFRKCVRVALEFGVDASKVTVDQPPNQ